ELFATLHEAEVLIANWRNYYNHERPHGALGYGTPAEALEGLTDRVKTGTPHQQWTRERGPVSSYHGTPCNHIGTDNWLTSHSPCLRAYKFQRLAHYPDITVCGSRVTVIARCLSQSRPEPLQ